MGNSDNQRWLTIDMLCSTLRLPRGAVKTLAKKGCLPFIGKIGTKECRYLDPTEEYKEQLRLAAVLHMKTDPIPMGISSKTLFTCGEVGQIIGQPAVKAKSWLYYHKVSSFKVGRTVRLYSIKGVRDALLRRENRILYKRRAPFLLPEIIAYLRSTHAEDLTLTPTDKEFRQDDILRKKLERLADLGDDAHADFTAKVELARRIVQILESANTNASPK